MDDQFINMLQYAAAAPAPLRIEVNRSGIDVETLALTKPYVVIGRHPSCDIVIDDKGVSARHVYLQAIGQRIAAIDLYSTVGTTWKGAEFFGWLTNDHTIKVPGAEIKLLDPFWINDGTLKSPVDFRPRDGHRDEYGVLPKAELELLNTSAKGKMWPINRVITLVGRDERCRITILNQRISRIHCSLLLLPSGLWVIDLAGKGGVRVNGQQSECAMLPEGAELKLGPYLLTARYPEVAAQQQAVQYATKDGDSDFLTRQNRIFKTQIFGDTVVIFPLGDSQEFFYQDIHNEANRVLDVIKKRSVQHVVIDFSQSEAVGHIIVESLSSFCRSVSGKSALCECTVATYELLKMTKLFSTWPHYQTRQDALQAVTLPD